MKWALKKDDGEMPGSTSCSASSNCVEGAARKVHWGTTFGLREMLNGKASATGEKEDELFWLEELHISSFGSLKQNTSLKVEKNSPRLISESSIGKPGGIKRANTLTCL